MDVLRSLAFFLVAGFCEIGGGYLVWIWLREGRSPWYAVIGAILLVLYGIIPTLQSAHFSRVYAAYGGVFVLLSIMWGWRVDGTAPDRFDLIGAVLVLLGIAVMMYWPRGG
ncbi:MAG: YnfA family protein [Chloroflexaceae bacterium]